MNRRDFGLLCASGLLFTSLNKDTLQSGLLNGNEVDSSTTSEPPIRLLLVVGGHGYDQKNLHEMLRSFPSVTFDEITIPEQQGILKPGLSQNYDVVVFHDQSFFELSSEQKEDLENLFGKEGIPTVMLHHSLISHPDYPFFRDLFGAQYLLKDTEIDNRVYPASSYLHPTEVNIYIAHRQHPITDGVPDFTITDEVFKNVYYNPHIDVLARTDHPDGDRPVVWTWQYKKSPVLGIIQGDAGGAFTNQYYRKIFYQGIRYIIQAKRSV